MPNPSYSEKLRDPRWQKKRLEIMQRDAFTCQECGAAEKTLNVHHCFYEYGKDPWDYPDSSLTTLCEDCHELESDTRWAKNMLCRALSEKGFRMKHFMGLAYSILQQWEDVVVGPDQLTTILEDEIRKFADFYSKNIADELGGLTNSNSSEDIPTGEGLSAGEEVERKSDAIA